MISPVKIWRNQKNVREHLGKLGTVITFTFIRVPPEGFEAHAPYPVVLVKLSDRNMVGQLVDFDQVQLKIGQKVKAVLRRVREPDAEGVIPYGIKFKPV
jgi:uncharacterized OB-fold protein